MVKDKKSQEKTGKDGPVTAALRGFLQNPPIPIHRIAKSSGVPAQTLYTFATGEPGSSGMSTRTVDKFAELMGLRLVMRGIGKGEAVPEQQLADMKEELLAVMAKRFREMERKPAPAPAREWPEGEAFEPAPGEAKILGRKGFSDGVAPRQRMNVPVETKREACRLIREEGYTAAAAAQKLGLKAGSIPAWLLKYDAGKL